MDMEKLYAGAQPDCMKREDAPLTNNRLWGSPLKMLLPLKDEKPYLNRMRQHEIPKFPHPLQSFSNSIDNGRLL